MYEQGCQHGAKVSFCTYLNPGVCCWIAAHILFNSQVILHIDGITMWHKPLAYNSLLFVFCTVFNHNWLVGNWTIITIKYKILVDFLKI